MSTSVGINMSRLRWGLAAALAVLAFVAAAQSMSTYQAQGMSVGLLAVIALAILLVVGLVSLGLARLRIGRELVVLRGGAAGTGSTLLTTRRKRLDEIKAAGARPDLEALSQSTRAAEAGSAYIGRYLVATTVLLGLVGTFAGLMQALAKLAPLFGDKDLSGLALLAAPLAGLHVTFGASLVAILATLALAIAQGDLALCEDQALATLEDRTTHELIPALWPAGDDAGERTVRAVEDLKAVFADALTRSIDVSLKRMSESARGEADRASRAIEAVATAVQHEIARLCATVSSGFEDSTRRQGDAADEATKRQTEALTAATALVSKGLGDVAGTVITGLRDQLAQVVSRASEAGTATLRSVVGAAEAALVKTSTATDMTLARSTAAIEEATHSAVNAIKESSQYAAGLQTEALRRSLSVADELLRATSESVEKGTRATSEAVARTLEPLFAGEAARLDDVRAGVSAALTGVELIVQRITALTSSFEGASRDQVAAMDRNAQALLATFDRVVVGGGRSLESAAGTLATAARDLKSGAEVLGPRIAVLANELAALGREVALLMTARGPDGDMGAVVLGELDRLSSGVDRLAALLHLAEGRVGAAAANVGVDGGGVQSDGDPEAMDSQDDGSPGADIAIGFAAAAVTDAGSLSVGGVPDQTDHAQAFSCEAVPVPPPEAVEPVAPDEKRVSGSDASAPESVPASAPAPDEIQS